MKASTKCVRHKMTDKLWGSALPALLWPEEREIPAKGGVLLYLDFCGVLDRKGTPPLPVDWCHPDARRRREAHQGLEPELVARLNGLLTRASAKVVLSTQRGFRSGLSA
jgi:hypothetical protein